MTLLLSNADVEQVLTYQDALIATEAILRELAEGRAVNRPRTQTYMPVESRDNPGFRYRFKSQEGGGVGSGVWALRITSDMAGFSYTAGVKRRRILPVATGNRWCGMVMLFDLERIEPVAIMPDGVIQKMRVAAGRRGLTCRPSVACTRSIASRSSARMSSIAAASAAR